MQVGGLHLHSICIGVELMNNNSCTEYLVGYRLSNLHASMNQPSKVDTERFYRAQMMGINGTQVSQPIHAGSGLRIVETIVPGNATSNYVSPVPFESSIHAFPIR